MNAQKTIFFLIIISIRCDEDLKVRVGLPEYICDKDGGVRDVSKDMTTIRLLGKDAQNINYKFDVNFRTIAKKCYHQRCTLLIWQRVRELDNYLQNYPLSKLQTGLIEINNTMFDPGIKYIINVQMTHNDQLIKEEQMTLDYVNDAVKEKIKKPMASLLLLGPDNSYAYATYVINAEVNICSNITTYYFKWEVTGSQNATLFPFKSAEFRITADTLQALKTYRIRCTLVNVEDNAAIAESQQTLKVLSKGLLLRLPLRRLSARTGQDVHVQAYMKDLDNLSGEIKMSWTCIETASNEECRYDSGLNELDAYSAFDKPGTYKVSLNISKSDFTETDSCIIEVLDNIPIAEIEDIEFPVNPREGVKILATIYELRNYCTLQWISPKEKNYDTLDLTTIPGSVDQVVNITMKEDFFLQELEEFTNGTVNKKHDLFLPPPTDTWEGLKGDAKYLIRLLITCPQDDILYDFNETAVVTTINDVIIETNASPVTKPLKVSPLDGDAFITTFTFKTEKAEDKDEPILYKFGYILDKEDVILWNLGEVTNCEGTLPYSVDGIQTFVETCDSFGSCGRVLGPLIKTKLSDKIDKGVILQRFQNKLTSEDYNQAFTEAFAILKSYNSKSDNTRDFITQRVVEEIEKYTKMENYDSESKNSANNLMSNVNEFSAKLELPEIVLNKILELRNKFSSDSERYSQRKLLSLRQKRASSLTLHEVKNYLEISELIITASSDPNKIKLEKEQLRNQLRNYMEKLCSNIKKNQLSLELKTVLFSVEKLKKNALFNFISVPFEGNSWQIFGRIKLGNIVKDSREKCVGKAVFKDYLDKNGIIYFTDILNTDDINEAADIVVYLPKSKTDEGDPKCLVYYNNAWQSECKTVQSIANFVKCSCKHLGYYYLEYTQTTTSTKMNKMITTTPEPITETVATNHSTIVEESNPKQNYDTISYVVIGISVSGIIILAIAIRKIFRDDDENEESETFEFPKYAQLHNEEFLNDAHI